MWHAGGLGIDILAPIDQPLDYQPLPAARGQMEHRGTVGQAPIRELRVLVEHRHHRLFAAGGVGLLNFAPDFSGQFGTAHSALLKSRVNCVGDLLVATVARDHARAGSIPIGPDPGVRVGSKFEEQLGHLKIPPLDRHVERAHFASALVDNLRPPREKFTGGLEIASRRGLVQFRGGHSVHCRFQLRPAFETIRPREDELGIM